MTSFIKGARYVLRGYHQLLQPSYRRYALLPALVAVVLLASIVGFSVWYLVPTVMAVEFSWALEGWASFLNPVLGAVEWLIKSIIAVLATLAIGFLGIYSFNALCNLVLSPWLGNLAEHVIAEFERENGTIDYQAPMMVKDEQTMSAKQTGLMSEIKDGVQREWHKIRTYLKWALIAVLPSIVLSWIPGLAALIWSSLTATWLSFEYADYMSDAKRKPIQTTREFLNDRRGETLGFGFATLAATLIPGVNLLMVPACVCGGTLWRLENQTKS